MVGGVPVQQIGMKQLSDLRRIAFADQAQVVIEQPPQTQIEHHVAARVQRHAAVRFGTSQRAAVHREARGRRRGDAGRGSGGSVPRRCRFGLRAGRLDRLPLAFRRLPCQGGSRDAKHRGPDPYRTRPGHRPSVFRRLACARRTLAGLDENSPRRPRNWFTSSRWFQP